MDPLIARLLLGESPVMQRLRALIALVAPRRLPVLIQGPTGSGKELVAEAVHGASGRRGVHVRVNVCTVPEAMFESVMYGHRRGSFTTAVADSRGLFLEAHLGTIFLDEIDTLPVSLQVKLLRVLELGVFRPVGAPQDQQSDVRVVAATHCRLSDLVDRGVFRPDLAFRLRGCVISVPPLSERLEDIPLLARHFLERNRLECGDVSAISDGALRVLQSHDWPGNVRELRTALEWAAMLTSGPMIEAATVRAAIEQDSHRSAAEAVSLSINEAMERSRLVAILNEVGGDTKAASERCDMARSSLYRRMKRLGIPLPGKGRGRPRGAEERATPVIPINRSILTDSQLQAENM